MYILDNGIETPLFGCGKWDTEWWKRKLVTKFTALTSEYFAVRAKSIETTEPNVQEHSDEKDGRFGGFLCRGCSWWVEWYIKWEQAWKMEPCTPCSSDVSDLENLVNVRAISLKRHLAWCYQSLSDRPLLAIGIPLLYNLWKCE